MVKKVHVFFILFVIWAFAFIFAPYWHAFGTFGFPFLKYVALVFFKTVQNKMHYAATGKTASYSTCYETIHAFAYY